MSVLAFLTLSFFALWCESQNVFARDECKQYDNNQQACNSHTFTISGYGEASCTYVALTTESNGDYTSAEKLCLPDHCGLFVNDQTRCESDIYCKWDNDDVTSASSVSRCYPECFHKADSRSPVTKSKLIKQVNEQICSRITSNVTSTPTPELTNAPTKAPTRPTNKLIRRMLGIPTPAPTSAPTSVPTLHPVDNGLCADGYIKQVGDISGCGIVSNIGDCTDYGACSDCANFCNSFDQCLSYECKPNGRCSLNTDYDAREDPYEDSEFCSKITCGTGFHRHIGSIDGGKSTSSSSTFNADCTSCSQYCASSSDCQSYVCDMSSNECTLNYVKDNGYTVTDCSVCSQDCKDLATCQSYSCSPVLKKCYLQDSAFPTGSQDTSYAFCSKVYPCADGYTRQFGDIDGWGDIDSVFGGISVTNCDGCAQLCNSKSNCKSYECSPIDNKCNLNSQANPTTGSHEEYVFCTKN